MVNDTNRNTTTNSHKWNDFYPTEDKIEFAGRQTREWEEKCNKTVCVFLLKQKAIDWCAFFILLRHQRLRHCLIDAFVYFDIVRIFMLYLEYIYWMMVFYGIKGKIPTQIHTRPHLLGRSQIKKYRAIKLAEMANTWKIHKIA